MKRPPLVNFRVDEQTFQRWEALDGKLPRGMKTTLVRQMFLLLLDALEKGKRLSLSEMVRAITGEAGKP